MSLNIDGTYTGYIYKVTNLMNNKCYVGQTTTTIEHRWGQHKTDYNNPNPMYKAFKKYGIENFKIEEISHYTRDTKEKLLRILNSKEIYYIKKFNSLITENGYNLSVGGDNRGVYNCFPVDVYNRNGKLLFQCSSAKETSRLLKGYDVTSIVDCCNGKTVPRIDYVFRFKEDPFDKYSIDRKTTGVPIYQFDLTGKLVNTYSSAIEAANTIGVNASSITSVVYGINKTCKGYYWNNKNEFSFSPIKDVRKAVDQYDKNGEYIKTFESAASAMRYLGLSSSSGITACCKGKVISSNNYIWRYNGHPFNEFKTKPDKKKATNTKPFGCPHPKKVDMYSINGDFIRTFDSMKNAADEINANISNVSACCLGKANTANGYVFRLSGEQFDKFSITGKTTKQHILIYDLFLHKLTEYGSKNKAYKETGVGYHRIEELCDGKDNHIYNNKIFLYPKDLNILDEILHSINK